MGRNTVTEHRIVDKMILQEFHHSLCNYAMRDGALYRGTCVTVRHALTIFYGYDMPTTLVDITTKPPSLIPFKEYETLRYDMLAFIQMKLKSLMEV